MKEKMFFDIHCHAMNLSHPNLLAFLKRLPLRFLMMIVIPIMSPIISLFGRNEIKSAQNLLSLMENDIGNLFLILEHYLIKDGTINNNVLTINNAKYNTIVLTPLLMDFGYRNIRSDTYYNIPPEKPIIEQTIDVFNGIRKYRNFELFENTSGN